MIAYKKIPALAIAKLLPELGLAKEGSGDYDYISMDGVHFCKRAFPSSLFSKLN